jgi:hypothetical protein
VSVDLAFRVFNALALSGWLVLLAAPRWQFGRVWIAGTALPATFSLAYLVIFIPLLLESPGGFGSTAALTTLLNADPKIILGAWLHYLAFDLFIGSWMASEARRLGVPHAWMVPVLLLTFLVGPVGWLAFIAVRGQYR